MKFETPRKRKLRQAYIATFYGDRQQPHPSAQDVLADLKRYCGINKGGIVVSPISRTVDPYASVYRAGMRDVYLRIAEMLGLDEDTNVETMSNDGSDQQ